MAQTVNDGLADDILFSYIFSYTSSVTMILPLGSISVSKVSSTKVL